MYAGSALLAVGVLGCTVGLLVLAWAGLEQLGQWNQVEAPTRSQGQPWNAQPAA